MQFMFKEMVPASTAEKIQEWNKSYKDADAKSVISFALNHFGDKISFASSMGAEDQLITSMIAGINKSAKIFTLDTGRLFQETYDLIQKTNSRYKINIKAFFPDNKQVEEMVDQHGINLFYDSVENRKRCCHIRKIVPLGRALKNQEAWFTGLRKEQTASRSEDQLFEWDQANKLIKINPLINWTEKEIWAYIHKNNIPYNPLHDKGFNSIGCLPCTRALLPGEETRAGRWWWENQGHKECGLHKK
jgi:phosphoadenosine phosphosulfate reductase